MSSSPRGSISPAVCSRCWAGGAWRTAGCRALDKASLAHSGSVTTFPVSTHLTQYRGNGTPSEVDCAARTCPPDGRLCRGRPGVARLALTTNVPVTPCALVHTDKIQPTGFISPWRIMRVEVHFGTLSTSPAIRGRDSDNAALSAATDEITQVIKLLSGQEYVDIYAADAKPGSRNAALWPPRRSQDVLDRRDCMPDVVLSAGYASTPTW